MVQILGSKKNGCVDTCWCVKPLALVLLMLICLADSSAIATVQEKKAEGLPSLGVTETLEQIVLPGSELTHRNVDPATTSLVVRVVDTFPHGDAYRYDISYFGMTAGEFDLRDYLVRKDGSSTEDLPPIPVEIRSILDEGQVKPNELETGGLTRFGGYWRMVIAGSVIWVLVLGFLLFGYRRRKVESLVKVERQKSLADLLKPSVEKAIAGKLPLEKYAELERFLFSFWQKKLQLDDLSPAEVLSRIRNHEESGPLIRQLEVRLHGGSESDTDTSIADLLAPYRNFSSEEMSDQDNEGLPEDHGATLG